MTKLFGFEPANNQRSKKQVQRLYEGSAENFADLVLQGSAEHVVFVFFSASWSAPCADFKLLLQDTIEKSSYPLRLVEIDMDKNRDLAMQLGVQTAPAVFIFYKQRPVDGFMGAETADQLHARIEHYARALSLQDVQPAGSDPEDARAAFNDGDIQTARRIYETLLEEDSASALAHVGLLRCAIADNDLATAEKQITQAPVELRKDPEWSAVEALYALVCKAGTAHAPDDDNATKKENTGSAEALYEKAMTRLGAGAFAESVDLFIESIDSDRHFQDGLARKRLLLVFDGLGAGHPLTTRGRKRLSSIMFR